MKLLNTVFVNTDIQHDCGHVLPATIELQGGDSEIQVNDSKRVTLSVFFTTKRTVRFFVEGGRVHRITECPKCHNPLPTSF